MTSVLPGLQRGSPSTLAVAAEAAVTVATTSRTPSPTAHAPRHESSLTHNTHNTYDAHDVLNRLQAAKKAWKSVGVIDNAARQALLREIAAVVRTQSHAILSANEHDCIQAERKGHTKARLARLRLDAAKIDALARAVNDIADQHDPLNQTFPLIERPNGMVIGRMAVPIGLLAMIFEARPNVTTDAAALSLRSGNAIMLRPGTDCFLSSRALVECVHEALRRHHLPEALVSMVPTPDRESVTTILHAANIVDLVIPRGGQDLVALVQRESRVPVLAHLSGLCHLYIDRDADVAMALKLAVNGKMRRVEICGATETLLVDRPIAAQALPIIARALRESGCELRGDPETCAIVSDISPATDDDWSTEYLDAVLSIRIVDDVDSAVDHINRYGSGHTDSICTRNLSTAQRFINRVDSAIVMHNTSTQYADGGEFGFGAEIGIATGRLHARGPVGADQLTTYKYVVRGNGQCRP